MRVKRMGEFARKRLAWMTALVAISVAAVSGCGQTSSSRPGGEESGTNREQGRDSFAGNRSAERYDLERDEARGGHTLSKHVGQTDEQLRERLQRERDISAASTWTDRTTAEEVVAEALRANRGRVENWIRRGYRRANLALHYNARRVIGRSLRRGEERPEDATEAVIVLRADGPDGFYVLTSYPEIRE